MTAAPTGPATARPHVDFPASSPHVLACGGTKLTPTPARSTARWSGTKAPATARPAAASATRSPRPDWQAAAGAPATAARGARRRRRRRPAVGLPGAGRRHAPRSSAAPAPLRPLWAALVCRLAEGAGKKFGLLAPLLYDGVKAGHDAAGLPRHHDRQQRRLQGRTGLGRLHRARRTGRRGPAQAAHG